MGDAKSKAFYLNRHKQKHKKKEKQEKSQTKSKREKGKRRSKMQENEKVRKNTGGDNGFTFEIVEHICVLGKGREEGYTKELNYVSFRGLPPKGCARVEQRSYEDDKGYNFHLG